MNERILKLAEQAHEFAVIIYEKRLETEKSSNVFFYKIKDKKFVQLIVQECKDLLFESSENNRLPIAVDDMVHIIDTHFGVEE